MTATPGGQGPRRNSSRGSTPRPRKLAGQERDVTAPNPAEQAADAPAAPDLKSAGHKPAGRSSAMARSARTAATPAPDQPDGSSTGLLAGRRTTKVLIGIVAVLALALVAQGVWFGVHSARNDDDVAASEEPATLAVPDDRPILVSGSVVQEASEAAATALSDIVARNFKEYDEGVAAATEQMTERFAVEYRETTDQIEDEFVANRTTVQARVVAQGVVRADATQAEVLVFLNQYVTKGPRKNQKTSYTPYRAVVTVVNTDRGWLVDGLSTK